MSSLEYVQDFIFFPLFQLESFDKNKDGVIELSEMAKLVSLCNFLVLPLLVLYSLKNLFFVIHSKAL